MLRISGDGSLRLAPGGVVSSGGVLLVSVAVHDNLVYVANAANGGSNYTGFRLRLWTAIPAPLPHFGLPRTLPR